MWFRSLVLAVSAGLLVMEGAIAQPDAIFRPIVSQIKAAAPVGWKIRLPSAIKLTAYGGTTGKSLNFTASLRDVGILRLQFR